MLISRGAGTIRTLKGLSSAYFKASAIRSHGTWNYRKAPPPVARGNIIAAEFIGGVAWWWVLWHCWTEPGHVLGEFEYPDARKWSDEELGIPEDLEIE